MDQILKKSEIEFEKYIQGISDEATNSILKLLKKEVDMENGEIVKMNQQLSQAKRQHNALLQERYEQKLRESDMQIEFLNRRMTRVNNRLKNSTLQHISNGPSSTKLQPSTFQSPRKSIQNGIYPSNDELKDERQILINAKSLINKFEQKNPQVQSNQSEPTKSILINSNNQSNYKSTSASQNNHNPPIIRQKNKGQMNKTNRRVSFDDEVISHDDTNKKKDNHSYEQIDKDFNNNITSNNNNNNNSSNNNRNNNNGTNNKNINKNNQINNRNNYNRVNNLNDLDNFGKENVDNPYNIKLKKVGLPADGKMADQELYIPNANLKVEEKKQQSTSEIVSPPPQHIPYSNGSPKPRNSNVIDIKEKHTNYNAIIRENIQREMNELTLKPIKKSTENTKVNVNKDSLTKGKFDFSGERGLTATNGNKDTSNQLTASKSMPFLSNPNITIGSNGNYDQTDSNNNNQQKLKLNSNNNLKGFDQSDGSVNDKSEYMILDPIESNETDESAECARDLINWDSRPILKELYKIKMRSIQNDDAPKQFKDYIDIYYYIFRGIKYADKYVRLYMTIINGEMSIYENSVSRTSLDKFDIIDLKCRRLSNDELEISDSRSDIFKIRISQLNKYTEFQNLFNTIPVGNLNNQKFHITPVLYDESPINENRKILIVDIGSCSIRAGVLKKQPTLPCLYFPNVAAIEKNSGDAVAVGIDACNPELQATCFITRLLKPDTTIEHMAFTSGGVELLFKLICERIQIDPSKYYVMLSVPHNVSQPIRTKLVNVLFYRLNFLGISMCGQSLLALHCYCEPTGILVDIGYRTEVLPVTHGIVQFGGVHRSLLGGHLAQIAMSHLLPLDVHSITDFFIIRHIMEQSCQVAESHEKAYISNPNSEINLDPLKLPKSIQKKLQLQHKDQCLPVEGFFNPEIYSLDIKSIPELIRTSINACPVDCRRKLTQNICLSGAASQFPGFIDRLQKELKSLLPATAKICIIASPDRAHYSYLGACFVAINGHFEETIVSRRDWEESETTALKKWHQ